MGRTANNLGVSELFNQQDVDGVISLFETYPYGEIVKAGGAEITLHDAGHILGSSIVEIRVEGKTIIFSGDLGNPPVPLLRDTELIKSADYVVMESTYGDRDHAPAEQKKVELERAVEDTVAKGGVLLMPSFAMERTQEILYELSDLKRNKRIPDIPIYLDSPLAIKATNIYKQFSEFYDEEAKKLLSSGKNFFDFPGLTFVEKSDQSIELDQDKSPKVIIAGSGMSNGGRIVNHEKIYLPIESTTLLIVGFQVEGTLGRRLRDGTKDVRIMGEDVTVRATVRPIESYSAHADQKRLLYWLSSIESPIKKVFLVHGEDTAKQALMGKIAQDLGQETVIPKEGESYEI